MVKKTIDIKTLLVILTTIALISFTVQVVLEEDNDFKELELAAVTGQVTSQIDEENGMGKFLSGVEDWLLES